MTRSGWLSRGQLARCRSISVSLSVSLSVSGALGVGAAGCRSLPPVGDRTSQGYTVEVRCHTPNGLPIPNVRIANPESGAIGLTDPQGKLSFRLEGYEGTDVTLKVEAVPDGVVLVDEGGVQRVTLKSIAGAGGPGVQAERRPLIHDILMRKNKEVYVVLVAAEGAPELPVKANGIAVGKLNSRGAGAFRVQGQPGEELKVAIDASDGNARHSHGSLQQTFTLPPASAILSFSSSVTILADNTVAEPAPPVVKFRNHHREHKGSGRRHHRPREVVVAPQVPERLKAPVQVPFRDIDLQKR